MSKLQPGEKAHLMDLRNARLHTGRKYTGKSHPWHFNGRGYDDSDKVKCNVFGYIRVERTARKERRYKLCDIGFGLVLQRHEEMGKSGLINTSEMRHTVMIAKGREHFAYRSGIETIDGKPAPPPPNLKDVLK